jgi:multidrug resistance protein, MATE family
MGIEGCGYAGIITNFSIYLI